jgi:hypothetical protein
LKVTQTEGWKMLKEGNYGGDLFSEIMKAINDYSWELYYQILQTINNKMMRKRIEKEEMMRKRIAEMKMMRIPNLRKHLKK